MNVGTDVMPLIADIAYHRFPPATVACCLTLHGGWAIVASSTCAKPEDVDESIGKRAAFDRAVRILIECERYHRYRRAAEESTS